MEKTNKPRYSRMKGVIALLIATGFVSVLAVPGERNETPTAYTPNNGIEKTAAEKQRQQESKAAFLAAYRVFKSPRCMNCHPAGDVPLQGDDSHLHTQGVKRGPDGRGLYALKCKNCHQDLDLKDPHLPPGHYNWHLPPANRKMVFEGKSARELATNFKDTRFTGFKSMDQFIEHVENDTLVRHSFTYGVRPPLSHDDFVAKIKEWIAKGAAIPDK